MSDLIEKGWNAMRDLRLECDQQWRESHEVSGPASPLSADVPTILSGETILTPGGLRISKLDDELDVIGEVKDQTQGGELDVDYCVEFPADMREWPSVSRYIWGSSPEAKVEQVPRKKFYEVAAKLSRLLKVSELI